MQQLLGLALFFISLSSFANPSYFEIKRELEAEQAQFRQRLHEAGITGSDHQILQLDQYTSSRRAISEMVQVLKNHRELLNQYPSLYPNNQEKMDQVLKLLIYFVHSAEFLSQTLPHQGLATVLSEFSTQQETSFIARLINRTKFHLKPHGENPGQRLHKTIARAQSWPIQSHPAWLQNYLDRAHQILGHPRLLNDRHFVDRPLYDFFYELKAGLLYQTGLVALPKNYYISHQQINDIQNSLLPGDIAVIKHYYKLTNLAFNGEWSHGLIYLGSWNKFKNYFDGDSRTRRFFAALCRQEGLNCDKFSTFLERKIPQVMDYYKNNQTRYQDHILPRVVLESKGEGVIISNIYEALRKDQLALFRPRMSIQAKAVAIYTSLQYMFRPYDYSFNFQSHGRLVCTEIIYNAYSSGVHSSIPDFSWEQSYRLGRPVVQATDIVKTFARSYRQGEGLLDFLYFLEADSSTGKNAFSTPERLIHTVAD